MKSASLKRKSKRISTKQRCKTVKKMAEHTRKVRKDKRKNPGKYAKSKKDPGVPNDCPFKEQVLKEVEQARQQKQTDKEKRWEEAKCKRAEAKAKAMEEKRTNGIQGLVNDAQKRQIAHEAGQAFTNELKKDGISDRSAKAYYKEFQKVVEVADVILEVIDSRDPLGTRCKEVESLVLSKGKRLVLVLNKADLVPKENLEGWVKYLRGELPSIAFKSSTQSQGSRLGRSKVDIAKSTDAQLQTSKCVGAQTLMALLGNYCRNKDIKTSIRVGVVGLPNVGKSSLINSLKRSKACNVGSTPGITKAMQEVQLDSKVKLLDCPGLVLASGLKTDASVALRNAMRVESMDDPITPVDAILHRCSTQQMCLQYNIPPYSNVQEFLSQVAIKMGKLKRGGLPNQDMSARSVLNDWNTGKIKYFTHPPETENKNTHVSAEVVTEFAKEFSFDKLDKMDQDDINELPALNPSETMVLESSGMVDSASHEADAEDMEDGEDSDEDDEAEGENVGQLSNRMTVAVPKARVKKGEELPKFKADNLTKLKKATKMREKKARKDLRRRDKVGAELADGLESAFGALGGAAAADKEEKYDFGKDFEM